MLLSPPTDEEGSHTPSRLSKRRGSLLHDIEEVDEDISSGGAGSIPPPRALTLERQFVEGGMYTVALQWKVPHPLPEGATGYCVYVNGESSCEVEDVMQTGVLVTGIPRKQVGWKREGRGSKRKGGGGSYQRERGEKAVIPSFQLVKISVRTSTEEGESPDPAKLVILNPREFFPFLFSYRAHRLKSEPNSQLSV